MFPKLAELLLIVCLLELIWIRKIQLKYIDVKIQLADILF